MHQPNILALCSISVLLAPSDVLTFTYPRVYDPHAAVYRGFYNSYGDGSFSVVYLNPTSVQVKWNLDHNASDKLDYITVKYRPRNIPPRLLWIEDGNYYKITDQSEPAWKEKVYTYSTPTSSSEEDSAKEYAVNVVDNRLLPNTLYDFQFKKVDQDSVTQAGVTFRTQGFEEVDRAGCFRILDASGTCANRTVKMYWPKDEGGYSYKLYNDFKLKDEGIRRQKEEELVLRISWKRYFVHIGLEFDYSGFRRTTSVVEIPAQEHLLPPLSVCAKFYRNVLILNWEKPKKISVDNYTIFLFDSKPNVHQSTPLDHVHIAGDQTSFELRNTGFKTLAISVNTAKSSSGLLFIPYLGPNLLSLYPDDRTFPGSERKHDYAVVFNLGLQCNVS